MHRSSESIGSIAAALAKAQGELTNPEKTLTASISAPGDRSGDHTFRYASLANGLDIVRKSLGRHEIATVQTTAIDAEVGLVRLTTMLAHSSGEWISSEWPVCSVNEIATPRRMGAALTYARRYALFALVGMAGEDDLDAPDTLASQPSVPQQQPNRSEPKETYKPGYRHRHNPRYGHEVLVLPSSESAILLRKLKDELGAVSSSEDLTEWAARRMAAKNSLTADDAKLVELAFQAKLDEFAVLRSRSQLYRMAATREAIFRKASTRAC